MGVALENARLFDETQRLLKETEQRAAELAVINRIQEGMAAELDFQAIVDLVGDKLREVFNTGDIGIRRPETNLIHFLYAIRAATACTPPTEYGTGPPHAIPVSGGSEREQATDGRTIADDLRRAERRPFGTDLERLVGRSSQSSRASDRAMAQVDRLGESGTGCL